MIWGPLFSQINAKDSLLSVLEYTEGEARILALMNLAQVTATSDPSESLNYSEEALTLSRELDDPLLIANALNGVAISFYYLGDQRRSLSYLVQSMDYMKLAIREDTTNLETTYRLAVFSGNAGNVYLGMGQNEKALECFLQAEQNFNKLLESSPDDKRVLSSLITCMNNKAPLYRVLGEVENAEQTLLEALELSRGVNYPRGIAMCLNNLGLIEIDRKDYSKALDLYQEALDINKELKDSIAIQGTYNNIGLIHEESGRYSQAVDYYSQALRISERIGYLYGISNTYLNIGKVYGKFSRLNDAESFLLNGLESARQGNILELQKQGYKYLSDIYAQNDRFRQALEAFRDYSAVKDSIFNLERSRQIAEMQTKYESEKKEQENILLRTDLELQKTAQQLLFIALAALTLIALLLVFLYRYKHRLLKQRTLIYQQEKKVQLLKLEKKEVERKLFEDQVFAEQEINRLQRMKLDEQNRKLAASALQVTAKNQILDTILQEIDQERTSGDSDPETCFKRIQRTVKSNLNLDKDWEQFKRHFEEVHPDFFIRLGEQFPELTPGEQKICAYYRINLGTNEIAQILNVTIGGVQKSRHRLRKKLGIDSETELNEFMLRF